MLNTHEKGRLIKEEKKSRYILKRLTIVIIFLLIAFLIYAGMLADNFPLVIKLLFFSIIFISLIGILVGISGIVQLKIYEKGFIPDYRPVSYSIRNRECWIPYKDILEWNEKRTINDTVLTITLKGGNKFKFGERGITKEVYQTLINELEKNTN